jgi:diguanylate cyclase (GGDEF)-like protein/PAS domain S-box-containing protein
MHYRLASCLLNIIASLGLCGGVQAHPCDAATSDPPHHIQGTTPEHRTGNHAAASASPLAAQQDHRPGGLALITIAALAISGLLLTRNRSLGRALTTFRAEQDALWQAMPCATVEIDGNGFVRRVWARSDLFAVTNPEHVSGRSVTELLPPDGAQQVLQGLSEAAEKGHVRDWAVTLPGEHGPRTLELSISTIQDTQGTTPRFVILSTDITDQLQTRERMEIALSVFSHAEDGILVTDSRGRLIDCNAAFSIITGFSAEEIRGRKLSLSQVCSQRAPSTFQNMWAALVVKGNWQGELRSLRKNDEQYWSSVKLAAVRNDSGDVAHYVGVLGDITALKDQQKALEHVSQHDALTGLPNRVLLADRLQQAIARTKRHGKHLAVVYIDLDGFKAINDNHGHSAGDQLLITVSQRMKSALRESDTVARLGGDEFAVVLTDLATEHDYLPVIERLLAAAADPVLVQDKVLRVSASIGVALYPQADADNADQLMRQADQAMYQAKLSGKNRYHQYDAARDQAIRSHHEMLDAIRQALGNDEFVLHYQPKVNMRSGEVIGAEALIRWQHPQDGLLPPARFLPFIENHPLSIDIGEWVIASALRQLDQWHRDGLQVSVSVNVGAVQLQHPDFPARLKALLAMHPTVPAECIEIEVLETSALADVAHTSQVMRACAEFGVRFALDDFGTGYSSLMYLKRLPVNSIKIDQGFVRHMLEDPDNLPILEGVLTLARGFNRTPVAEGVETVAHGTLLLQLGCELGQGYGIARPMPAEQVAGWARNWQPPPAWSMSRRVNNDSLPLLLATTELDAWVRATAASLAEERASPGAIDLQNSRLGRWLANEGARLYGGSPAFLAMRRMQQQGQALVVQLSAQQAGGDLAAAQQTVSELQTLVTHIGGQLGGLMRMNAPEEEALPT